MTFRQARRSIEQLGYRIQAQTRIGDRVRYDACDMKIKGRRGRLVKGPTGTSQEAMTGLLRLVTLREGIRVLDADI